MTTQQEHYQRIAKLLESIDIAMFTTRGRDGHLVSRPLSTQVAEFDGTVWFMVNARSSKVGEIARDRHVNVGYASKDKNTYVSVSGLATVLRDQARIDAMWNDGYKAFWPEGPADPDLRLIRVDVATVEYWDGPGTLVGQAISFVIARVTGDDSRMGENKTLRVTGRGRARVLTDGDPNDPGSRPGRRAGGARKASKATPTSRATPATKRPAKTAARTAAPARKAPAVKKAAGTRTVATGRKGPASKAVAKKASRPATAKNGAAKKATWKKATATKSPAKRTPGSRTASVKRTARR